MPGISTVFLVCLFLLQLIKPILCFYNYENKTRARYVVEIIEPFNFHSHSPIFRCNATGADFGEPVNIYHGNFGCALPTTPTNACSNVTMPIMTVTNETSFCADYFAVVPRYDCSFSEKAYHVQKAKPYGFGALIVYNPPGKAIESMSSAKYFYQVKIPIIMVDYECMKGLLYHSYRDGYIVTITLAPGSNLP